MIGSLVYWLGWAAGSGRSGRRSGAARRFTPGLETLEGREVPGALGILRLTAPAALLGVKLAGHHTVSRRSSKPGGGTDGILHGHVSYKGYDYHPTKSVGEEIPQ
jgi:hypothetical protein